MKTAAFHTLGCKVNQYDTQAMLEKFRAAGYEIVPFDADADVYVINTCTVTGTGDKKSMQIIRRCHRQNPQAQIVVTGCLAQRAADELTLPGVAGSCWHTAARRGRRAAGAGHEAGLRAGGC